MAKALLLGNGINACIGIDDLSRESIQQRFLYNSRVYSPIIEGLFGVEINKDFLKHVDDKPIVYGIETLARFLYDYIKTKSDIRWTVNAEYRVQDVVSSVCLSAIFYLKDGKISGNYDRSKMPPMDKYDYIFTLNYVEFWDIELKSIYLHGRVDFTKLVDAKNAVFVSKDRMNLKKYAIAAKDIEKSNTIIEFSPNNVIFAPEGLKKNKLICVSGISPSDSLFPADDLFLYRGKELYTEFDKVDEIDIFGMSPYGDDSIIDIINNKNMVKVYIHNKEGSIETNDWNKKLNCSYELLDSMEIYG